MTSPILHAKEIEIRFLECPEFDVNLLISSSNSSSVNFDPEMKNVELAVQSTLEFTHLWHAIAVQALPELRHISRRMVVELIVEILFLLLSCRRWCHWKGERPNVVTSMSQPLVSRLPARLPETERLPERKSTLRLATLSARPVAVTADRARGQLPPRMSFYPPCWSKRILPAEEERIPAERPRKNRSKHITISRPTKRDFEDLG